jgi:indolepyruvate decarboxylase
MWFAQNCRRGKYKMEGTIMPKTVIRYLLNRLKDLGIRDIFDVPGDYTFSINNAICDNKELRWIGCCNELSSAYAADGYARINGMSVFYSPLE